jgi:hypothetical protein
MSSVNVAELRSGLVKAKHLIREPHMWGKGMEAFEEAYKIEPKGPFCVLGACMVSDLKVYNAMSKALFEQALLLGKPSVAGYNDEDQTTHSDIIALLDRAISALDIQEFLSIANEAEKPLVNLTDALNRAWLAYGVDE